MTVLRVSNRLVIYAEELRLLEQYDRTLEQRAHRSALDKAGCSCHLNAGIFSQCFNCRKQNTIDSKQAREGPSRKAKQDLKEFNQLSANYGAT